MYPSGSSTLAASRHTAALNGAGSGAMRAASSHALVHLASGGVTACLRCGPWATRRPRRPLRQCPGVAPTSGTKQARKRIRLGVHPLAKLQNHDCVADVPTNLHAAQTARCSWRECLGMHGQKEGDGRTNGPSKIKGRNAYENAAKSQAANAKGSRATRVGRQRSENQEVTC